MGFINYHVVKTKVFDICCSTFHATSHHLFNLLKELYFFTLFLGSLIENIKKLITNSVPRFIIKG